MKIKVDTEVINVTDINSLAIYYKEYRDNGFFKAFLSHNGLDDFEKDINRQIIADKVQSADDFITCIKNRNIKKILSDFHHSESYDGYKEIYRFLNEMATDILCDDVRIRLFYKIFKWYYRMTSLRTAFSNSEIEYIKHKLSSTLSADAVTTHLFIIDENEYYQLHDKKVLHFTSKKEDNNISTNISSFAYGNFQTIIYINLEGMLCEDSSPNAKTLWEKNGKPELAMATAYKDIFQLLTKDGKVLTSNDSNYADGQTYTWIGSGLNSLYAITESGNLIADKPAVNGLKITKAKYAQINSFTDTVTLLNGCHWFAINEDCSLHYGKIDNIDDKKGLGMQSIPNIHCACLFNNELFYCDDKNVIYKIDINKGGEIAVVCESDEKIVEFVVNDNNKMYTLNDNDQVRCYEIRRDNNVY